jgi:hypothetical protein
VERQGHACGAKVLLGRWAMGGWRAGGGLGGDEATESYKGNLLSDPYIIQYSK